MYVITHTYTRTALIANYELPPVSSYNINGAGMHLAADGVTYTPYVTIGKSGELCQLCSFDEGDCHLFCLPAAMRKMQVGVWWWWESWADSCISG
jgi:hypothetical protein